MGYPNENVFCAIVNMIEAKWPIKIPYYSLHCRTPILQRSSKIESIYLISSIAVKNPPAIAM
jgi:hypothetical protein